MMETTKGIPWPVGGGSVGKQIRSQRGAGAALGPAAGWPQSLKTALDICLESPDPAAVIWGAERVLLYNDFYAEAIAGDRHAALFGQPLRADWPDVREPLLSFAEQVFADGAAVLREGVGDPQGERCCTFHLCALPDETGAVAGVFHRAIAMPDAPGKPEKTEARYRRLLDSLGDAVLLGEVISDDRGRAVDHRLLEVNAACASLTGRTVAQMIGKTVREMIPGIEESWIQRYGAVARTGKATRFADRAAGLGGRWYDGYAFRLGGENSRLVATLFSDITERRQSEAVLRASESMLSLIYDNSPDCLYLVVIEPGDQFRFVSVNATFLQVTGYARQQVINAPMENVIPKDNITLVRSQFRQVIETRQPVNYEETARLPSGLKHAEITLAPVFGQDGAVTNILGVIRDATEEKRSEEALQSALQSVARANEELEERVARRTEELVRMGEMRQELLRQLVTAQEEERARISRDLHDDTGQQVTALLLGLNHLKTAPALAADPEAQEILTRLEAQAGEVAKKSHQLSFTLRPTALDDIGLMGTLQNYADEWSHWSGIAVDLQSVGLNGREGDREGEFVRLPPETETTIYRVTQEALTNVLRHAVLPDPHGGQAATRVSVLLQRGARNVVTIIEDDGPGFDVDGALSLPPGKQRLGIFGMQERARLAGGTLTVESEPGKGSTVFLRLPLSAPE